MSTNTDIVCLDTDPHPMQWDVHPNTGFDRLDDVVGRGTCLLETVTKTIANVTLRAACRITLFTALRRINCPRREQLLRFLLQLDANVASEAAGSVLKLSGASVTTRLFRLSHRHVVFVHEGTRLKDNHCCS